MSFYIKPKFKIGQIIFSIKEDKIIENVIESFVVSDNSIAYLSGNELFCESQSFSSEEEAKDFLENSIRIPFTKNSWCWSGDLTGVSKLWAKATTFFYKEDLKHPYNSSTHAGNIINHTSCFETQIKATQESLKQVKQYYKIKE